MAKETIIILDPEANAQWPLRTLLAEEGFNVIWAKTIEEAMKKFSEYEVSGLITEYWVNHSSTVEIIRGFKKTFPDGYVVVLTIGELPEKEYEAMLNAGADDYFQKPFSVQKILLHLRKGLKQRQNLIQKRKLAEELSRNSLQKHFPG